MPMRSTPMRGSEPFRILAADDPADARAWLSAWEAWPEREVFAHPAYVRLSAGAGERARCALLTTPGGSVLYPFLHRDLSVAGPPGAGLPGAGPPGPSDLTSPYGYGGPFVWGAADDDARAVLAASFWPSFDAWCAGAGVVSEFVRFHLGPGALLAFPGDVRERMPNVVVPLDRAAETMWTGFEHKVRKNVNRARRSGVTVEFDRTGERLGTFLEIYEATMGRREASAHYYFPRTYFEAIHRDLPGQFVYAFAMHEGRAVSAELVLVSASSLYSFLGGTLREAFDVRPNDLLKVEVMAWGQREGRTRFVLGGGVEPGDGIYRYKLSFAPSGSVPFSVGSRVHDAVQYDRLTDARREAAARAGETWAPPETFFPAYRA